MMRPVFLEDAILKTLAYSDVFNFPLKLEELKRYLTTRSGEVELSAALTGLSGRVQARDGYYFLPGRDEIVDLRRARERMSQAAFRRAAFYGRLLGLLPFIRMAAITGSLAVLNSEAESDLDFMLVAAPGRVWLARAFALLLNRLVRRNGNALCPNLVVSEHALAWRQRDLYAARELCQMVPVAGPETYRELLAANPWIQDFLPNAHPDVPPISPVDRLSRFLQWLLELPLHGVLGNRLEDWERERKIARFTRQSGYGAETFFSADLCQGNFDHHGESTRRAYEARLLRLGLLEAPSQAAPIVQNGFS